VCIDPGHGGKDPGAMSKWGLREKDVVLSTAGLLEDELKSRGFDVRLTRSSDVFIELEDRPAVASRTGCDLFVAIHANAIRDPSYRGIEIYYWYGSWSAASAATRREGVELAEASDIARGTRLEKTSLDIFAKPPPTEGPLKSRALAALGRGKG